jgi:DNA-binding protein WhiA
LSFSTQIKEEFSKSLPGNKEILKNELLGYFLSSNTIEEDEKLIFVTENEFNIERFYRILYKLGIDYEPNKDGKKYEAIIEKQNVLEILNLEIYSKEESVKAIARGCFLGSGYVNNPENQYHLEINFTSEEKAKFLVNICKQFNLNLKILTNENKTMIYIKEGDEIANFLAFIGANSAVLKFQEIRVIREIKNNINRKVNCETANLNKTINAAVNITKDIELIKKHKKFDSLDEDTKELLNLRIENPEMTLKDLGGLLTNKLGKSGVKYRLDKIHKMAEELRN